MKLSIIIFLLIPLSSFSQKTTRDIIANSKGISITRIIRNEASDVDTVFMMSGQNVKYTHITDIVTLKYGPAAQVNNLLSECLKALPEKQGTSIEFDGNEIHSAGNGRLLLYGVGDSQQGCVLLTKNTITKLLTDLKPYLK
jgi:hypothetical protein